MSKLIATITKIQSVESLNIVSFDFMGEELTMMSLDLSEEIEVAKEVSLGIKPSSVAIAKEFSGVLSYSNQLNAVISEIDNGELLSSLKLEVNGAILESIITCNSSKKMELKIGDKVKALIKANEISILSIIQ